MKQYVMVIDEGTTGVRSLIFNKSFDIVASAYEEFTQYTPAEDRVEHDAMEIYDKSIKLCKDAMDKAGLKPEDILTIGITNQRATSVIWDPVTGLPIEKAIVWQDTRMAAYSEEMNATEWGEKARKSTGWTVSPVYSSLMLKWYVDNIPGLGEKIEKGEVMFGTMDTFLLWKMTGGKEHKVGYSNASVMGSMNLETCTWDKELLDYLGVPVGAYPEIVDDATHFGDTYEELFGASISIHSLIADQHASVFALGCVNKGDVKATNGTGTFLDVNTGTELVISDKGINSLVCWKIGDEITYGIEGYAAVTGSAVQWLRDGLRAVEESPQTEAMALSVEDSNGVVFVPALAGLSAPYHDPFARGTIFGITRGTKVEHIVRATLEAIAFRCKDITDAVEAEGDVKVKQLMIDGGASKNNFLAQELSDMMNCTVERPASVEGTSLGAAQMAGLAAGLWTMEDFKTALKEDRVFTPEITEKVREERYNEWKKAISRALGWKA